MLNLHRVLRKLIEVKVLFFGRIRTLRDLIRAFVRFILNIILFEDIASFGFGYFPLIFPLDVRNHMPYLDLILPIWLVAIFD